MNQIEAGVPDTDGSAGVADAGGAGDTSVGPGCALDNGGCDPLVTCSVVRGEVRCGACPRGYKDDNADGTRCTDIDECAQQTDDCKRDATCQNTGGGFDCPCDPGYHGDGHKACLTNVLCDATASNCAPQASCMELDVLRYCVCASGYEGDGTTCTDVDECLVANGGCDTAPKAACTNNLGAPPTCACPMGYSGSGVGADGCADIDECMTAADTCSRDPAVTCTNTTGGFECGSCPAGYEGDGHTCTDIDECLSDNGGCDLVPMAACINRPGSRDCACPRGYSGTGVGSDGCHDVDECRDGSHTCSRNPAVACTNTPGSFSCGSCPSGYTGDGHTCTDINECKTNNGGCDPLVSCTNTPGGRDCGACPPYHRGSGDAGCIPFWTQQLGTSENEEPRGITTDLGDNVYVVGHTEGSLDGNTSAGATDIFLLKYSSGAQRQWTRQFGTSTYDSAEGVAADASGNAFVVGHTFGGLDGNTSAGSNDLLVVKYSSAGNKLWTRQLGTSSQDYASGIATDMSGNVYAAGHTQGDLDGNVNAGGHYDDSFIVKYDNSGQKQWTRQFGASLNDIAHGVATDSSGNIYVVGESNSTEGLDGNVPAGDDDLFVVKYNAGGQRQWTRQLGTSASDQAQAVATDASANVYVVGSTGGNLDGNPNAGGVDIFIVKYNAAGQKQWTAMLGTAADEQSPYVATDASGSVYVAGTTRGSLNGNASAGGPDAFLSKYNSAGARQWTRQLGTASSDYAAGVAADSRGAIYVTGLTSGGLDGHSNAGGHDVFVAKYSNLGEQL